LAAAGPAGTCGWHRHSPIPGQGCDAARPSAPAATTSTSASTSGSVSTIVPAAVEATATHEVPVDSAGTPVTFQSEEGEKELDHKRDDLPQQLERSLPGEGLLFADLAAGVDVHHGWWFGSNQGLKS